MFRHIPAQPFERAFWRNIRHFRNDRPVPPIARLPRCTTCQSFTVPSIAEYGRRWPDHDGHSAKGEWREHGGAAFGIFPVWVYGAEVE